jgi:hypothetical protein
LFLQDLNERLPSPAKGETFLVHVVWMQLNFCASRFLGQDTGVMILDAMIRVYAVFG